jgi:hypothetical protein
MHAVVRAMALTLLCLTIAPASAAEPSELILPMMVFTDMGHLVHVQGTLTGEGLGYKNNHVGLTCYREKAARRRCLLPAPGSSATAAATVCLGVGPLAGSLSHHRPPPRA